MRPIVATILLSLMTFQVSYRGIVFSSYYANKEYIAAVLCVNQDKPELDCEGKCYLKKQLQKADTPADTNTSGLTLKLETSPFTSPVIAWEATAFAPRESITHTTSSEEAYSHDHHLSCFHPPQV